MEKVKLPKEVAEAIDTISRMQNWKMRIMECMFDDSRTLSKEMSIVKTFFFNTGDNGEIIMSALVNGYEVEMTPEERIKCAISNAGNLAPIDSDTAYIRGIRVALEIYGIKIPGVNAE